AAVQADVEAHPLAVLHQEVLAAAAGPVVRAAGVGAQLGGVGAGGGGGDGGGGGRAGQVRGGHPAQDRLAPGAHVAGRLAVLAAGDVAAPAAAGHQAPVADAV